MRKRLARFTAAGFAILGILFSQVALSAYACPMDAAPARLQAADTDCCPDAASDNASLCAEHCKASRAAVADVAPVPPAFVPAFTATVAMPVVDAAFDSQAAALFTHATSPPLSILNCCFRI